MPKLLKAGNFAIDAWQRFDGDVARLVSGDALLFPLPVWLAQRDALLARKASRTGLWLNGDDEPEQIAADIHRFGCIAVNFPAFMDGRGFSCGRLLRERYGFRGELRAVGDIFVDQLHFLRRCGFDAFELPDGTALDVALNCLDAFSVYYQAACDRA
ncbi:MAG: DUF934 domain-containing protein [Porticoccaceae bacterium]